MLCSLCTRRGSEFDGHYLVKRLAGGYISRIDLGSDLALDDEVGLACSKLFLVR